MIRLLYCVCNALVSEVFPTLLVKRKNKTLQSGNPLVVLHISPSLAANFHLSHSRFSSPLDPQQTHSRPEHHHLPGHQQQQQSTNEILHTSSSLWVSPKHTHGIIFHHFTSTNVHLWHIFTMNGWHGAALCGVLCALDLDNDMLPSTSTYCLLASHIPALSLQITDNGKTFLLGIVGQPDLATTVYLLWQYTHNAAIQF